MAAATRRTESGGSWIPDPATLPLSQGFFYPSAREHPDPLALMLAVLYSTFPSIEAAESAGRALVDAGLVACVNLFPAVVSIYQWEGALQKEFETVMIGKTTAEAVPAAVARLREIHPYQVPCITWWPLAGAAEPYAAWVAGQIRPG